MYLPDKENKILLNFEKYVKRIRLNYIAAGFLLCIAIVGFIYGIKFNSPKGFIVAVFFGIMGTFILSVSHAYQTLYGLINKMKQYYRGAGEEIMEYKEACTDTGS